MPGPKMGPRPADFDEQVIRQSPTFIRWISLELGEKLRYACREFVRGQGDDEERLMRRIMIARRNNLRDHVTLKRARSLTTKPGSEEEPNIIKVPKVEEIIPAPAPSPRKRRPSTLFSDAEVAKEMDISAVEATRSFRSWLDLPDNAEFVYNQKYVKGRDGHDWLLRKNIWRRMRYRRENKKMVETMRHVHPSNRAAMASQIIDQTLLHPPPEVAHSSAAESPTNRQAQEGDYEVSAAVEAAVAVAESYAKSPYNVVHNPLEAAASSAALDAAAQLAAAAADNDPGQDHNDAVAAATAAAPGQYDD
jgi:hypothetical protein